MGLLKGVAVDGASEGKRSGVYWNCAIRCLNDGGVAVGRVSLMGDIAKCFEALATNACVFPFW